MRLIAQIKLQPTPQQHIELLETLERTNAACNAISKIAWAEQLFGRYHLHRRVYRLIRAQYGLSAQQAVRAIAKVADAYKRNRNTLRRFTSKGAIAYDSRLLRYHRDAGLVSIRALGGRLRLPYLSGDRQRALLAHQQGESDLVYRGGAFYLLATCEVETPALVETEAALGVDLGILNLATDSDGQPFSGAAVEKKRQWHQRRRSILQSVGSRSAKRRLKQLSGRQRRFQKAVNHVISKRLVEKAKGTSRSIALEDLSGIGEATVRKSQRSRHHNWSFYDLRFKIQYKARMAGIPVLLVSAAYSSQQCSGCGHQEKANRHRRAFICRRCGLALDADLNAALNIGARGVVNRPMVASMADTA